MIYLTNINLNQNELQNAVIQPLAVAPPTPKLGQIYTDSTNNLIKWWNGSAWKTIGVVVESSTANGSIKVDGVEMTVYTLPKATATELGGIKLGSGLVATDEGVVSIEVVNNLTTSDPTKPLSAAMGKSLQDSINQINDSNIPTKLSDLVNDEGFIDNTVSNLANYYLKSETYNQAEVNTLIGNLATIQILIPDSGTLPGSGASNTIYLIPKPESIDDQSIYDEYLWTGSKFEHIGDTTIDLSNYLTKTGDASNTTVSFITASDRTPIVTGESLGILLGKVSKYLADLKSVAFTGSYTDLSDAPAQLVKYATGVLPAGSTTASLPFSGTLVDVSLRDLVTGEMLLADITIEGSTANVSLSQAHTNSIIILLMYST